MANVNKQVPENVAGDYFVDTTCIDCDTCRQLAPSVFAEAEEYAYVHRQPQSEDDRRQALRALLSCPTGSIGCQGGDDPKQRRYDFPLLIEEPVYYCGYTSRRSFGGSSYFIKHEHGNWLIDSPKFLPPLVRQFEALGGIAHIFLTHEDDVADADKYASRFSSVRYIHREELHSQPAAEQVLDGNEPHALAPGLLAIPTPGHTRGHCCLLYNDRYLFTGDHLSWNRQKQRLSASRSHCWYSWKRQTESMSRLAAYRFEWVLPGHGQRIWLAAEAMHEHLRDLLERMKRP